MKPIRFQPAYFWRTIMMIASIALLFVPGFAFFLTPNLGELPQTFMLLAVGTVAALILGYILSRKFPIIPSADQTRNLPSIVQFAAEEARREKVSLVCVSFSKQEPSRRVWGTLYLPAEILDHPDAEEAKALVVFCMRRRENVNLFILTAICVTFFFIAATMFVIPFLSASVRPMLPMFIPMLSLFGMPIMMELSRRDCVNAVAVTVERFGDPALVERALNLAKRPVSPWRLYERDQARGQARS